MAFTQPMTPAEYQKKYGVPVSFDMPNDSQSKAAHGFGATVFAPQDPAFNSASEGAKKGNMVTRLLGLNPAVDVFSSHIARSDIGAKLMGGSGEASREFIEKPTAGQTAGALLQTGVTAASPLIAPISIPGMMVAGGALGYGYDVGGDMVAQESLGKTLTPGVGTAAGIVAPPILKTAIGVSAGVASTIGRSAAQQVPRITSGLASFAEGTANVARHGADSLMSRAGRAVSHGADTVTGVADKAARIKSAPANARPAIRVGIDDDIIRLATDSNPQTIDSMRQMVQLAERGTGKAGTGPGKIAGDRAVEQLHLIEQAKRDIGAKIGEASRNLPQAQSIDIAQSVRTLDDVLSQNGILRQADGTFSYTNKAITPEQKKVIENLYKLATEDKVLSAQQIHQMDQLFSKLQRQSNVIDKVDNIFVEVPTPEGSTKVNLFKVFRDVFGKQLDELSPDMRALNTEYRKLTNLVDDIEGSIAKTPGFESLPMNDNYAEAGLRQMFGRGQKADQLVDLYEIMDSTSRSLGYQGARADDLYQFALELNKIYPETIPPTSFEGNIISGMSQAFRKLVQTGQVTPKDQQKALRKLLEMDTSPTSFNQGATPRQLSATENTVPGSVAGVSVRNPIQDADLRQLVSSKGFDYNKISGDANRQIALAAADEPYVHAQAKQIVDGIPDTIFAPGPLKKVERVIEKAVLEEAGDLSAIKDIARNTIIPLNRGAQDDAVAKMLARGKVEVGGDISRHKVQSPEDFLGYEGHIFNIRTPNGSIAETQIVSPQMTFGKNTTEYARTVLGDELFEKIRRASGVEPGRGHKIYEQIRSMDRSAPNYLQQKALLENESVEYYNILRNIEI